MRNSITFFVRLPSSFWQGLAKKRKVAQIDVYSDGSLPGALIEWTCDMTFSKPWIPLRTLLLDKDRQQNGPRSPRSCWRSPIGRTECLRALICSFRWFCMIFVRLHCNLVALPFRFGQEQEAYVAWSQTAYKLVNSFCRNLGQLTPSLWLEANFHCARSRWEDRWPLQQQTSQLDFQASIGAMFDSLNTTRFDQARRLCWLAAQLRPWRRRGRLTSNLFILIHHPASRTKILLHVINNEL